MKGFEDIRARTRKKSFNFNRWLESEEGQQLSRVHNLHIICLCTRPSSLFCAYTTNLTSVRLRMWSKENLQHDPQIYHSMRGKLFNTYLLWAVPIPLWLSLSMSISTKLCRCYITHLLVQCYYFYEVDEQPFVTCLQCPTSTPSCTYPCPALSCTGIKAVQNNPSAGPYPIFLFCSPLPSSSTSVSPSQQYLRYAIHGKCYVIRTEAIWAYNGPHWKSVP